VEPTSFEKSLRRPEKVVVRHHRARLLQRIFEFARVSLDEVVNDRAKKLEVARLYRIADECEWESRRRLLADHAEAEAWVRENR
jgi:hypothetical protein